MTKLEEDKLRRTKKDTEEEQPNKKADVSVSAGKIDRVVDWLVNTSRDKMREVTVITQWEGMQFPLLDMVNKGLTYLVEIAAYRDDPDNYEKIYEKKYPVYPDLIDELLYRKAQWGRSVKGRGLDMGKDMVLAELETSAEEKNAYGGGISDEP